MQARKWLGAAPLVSRPIPPLACTGQLHAGLQLTWASENRPCYPERVSGDLAFIRPGPEGYR